MLSANTRLQIDTVCWNISRRTLPEQNRSLHAVCIASRPLGNVADETGFSNVMLERKRRDSGDWTCRENLTNGFRKPESYGHTICKQA